MKSRAPNFSRKNGTLLLGFLAVLFGNEVSGVKAVWCKNCWCTRCHVPSGVKRFLCKSCLV